MGLFSGSDPIATVINLEQRLGEMQKEDWELTKKQ